MLLTTKSLAFLVSGLARNYHLLTLIDYHNRLCKLQCVLFGHFIIARLHGYECLDDIF
jgi:hypothetical protein